MKKKRKKIVTKKKGNKYDVVMKFDGSPDEALKSALTTTSIKKSKMEIIGEIKSRDIKWEVTAPDEFDLTFFKGGEKQAFQLNEIPNKQHHIFYLRGIFHVTCEDTNFLLDTEIESLVELDFKGALPTAKDLYEVYKKVNVKWNEIIKGIATKEGYELDLKGRTLNPFDLIKRYLDETIYNCLEGI